MTLKLMADAFQTGISIHMPHTWHDKTQMVQVWEFIYISIHMPHTWHDDWKTSNPEDGNISIHMPHTWHDPKR